MEKNACVSVQFGDMWTSFYSGVSRDLGQKGPFQKKKDNVYGIGAVFEALVPFRMKFGFIWARKLWSKLDQHHQRIIPKRLQKTRHHQIV